MKKKVALLVSGGVDSALCLHLLHKDYAVTPFYIKIWNPEYDNLELNSCPWKEDVDYVEKLCNKYNLKYNVLNMQLEYQFTVMEYMISELKKGRTPNPDVFCNYYIKFGMFFDHINLCEFDYVASGHYATKLHNDSDYIVWHENDPVKDQTFFLSKIKPETIKKIIFPLSGLSKKEVRRLAKEANLPQKEKKDSQGLCFIGNVNYGKFISNYIPNKEGDIIDVSTQEVIGKHNGIHLYTEGQRKGLDLPNGPWYVFSKDAKHNTISVVNRKDFHKYKTNNINFDKVEIFHKNLEKNELYLKIRHPQPTLIKVKSISLENKSIEFNNTFYPWNFSKGQVGTLYASAFLGNLKVMIGNITI